MPWPEQVLRQFKPIASYPTIIENEFHGAYNKLLNALFPLDSDFTAVPQHLESNSLTGTEFIVMFEVTFHDGPVFVLELKKSSNLLYDSRRRMADDHIRQRLIDLRRQCPIPTVHGVSAIGTRLCFYRLDLTQPRLQIFPPAIPGDPCFTIDTAPEERWDCSVLEAEGEVKLRAVMDEIKQACALVEI
ncbi:hypothetical protein F5146DRAFT_1144090 [Armillaria mellea]|nr:hypothetical protein F5146DRAFT_1144090 [Armillaria mellea]